MEEPHNRGGGVRGELERVLCTFLRSLDLENLFPGNGKCDNGLTVGATKTPNSEQEGTGDGASGGRR